MDCNMSQTLLISEMHPYLLEQWNIYHYGSGCISAIFIIDPPRGVYVEGCGRDFLE